MKKIFTFILLSIVSYAVMVVGRLQEHPVLMYLGVVVGGALALGFLVWLVRMTAKFVGWAFTSVLYLLSAMAVLGILSWKGVIPGIVGFGAGAFLGGCLLLVLVRRLGRWAQKSIIGGEVFSFASGYQIKSYICRDTIVDRETAITINVDFKNIVLVLKELGFPAVEAKKAATYALAELPSDLSLDDRIKEAIKFLGSKDTVEIYKAQRN